MKNYLVKSPILLVMYNRPDKTYNLLNNLFLTKNNFSKIYIKIDGPKNKNDEFNVQRVTEIINSYKDRLNIVDIKAEQGNLGLQKNIILSVDYVLSKEKTVIVLEDDQLASKEFFEFCDLMLEKYATEEKIFQISGSCYLPNSLKKNFYYLSKFPDCVGWATWRNSWKKLRRNLSFSEVVREKVVFNYYKNLSISHWFYEYLFREHFAEPKKGLWTTWWQLSIIYENGLSINPMRNLVIHDGLEKSENQEHFDERYLKKKKIVCEKINLNDFELYNEAIYNEKLDNYNFKMIKKTDPIFRLKNRIIWIIRFYYRYHVLKKISKSL